MADDTQNSTDITTVSILGKHSIHCGFHLVPYIVRIVVETIPASTYVLITDTNVANYHLDKFRDEFASFLPSKASSSRFLTTRRNLKVPRGKSFHRRLPSRQICRCYLVCADLPHLCSHTQAQCSLSMRGVRFVQIPTTLLAMVDSSVGGKIAIDTPHGKNLVGACWQPEYIFIDAAFLETLPLREFSNGMAEVVKVWLPTLTNSPLSDFLTCLDRRHLKMSSQLSSLSQRRSSLHLLEQCQTHQGHTLGSTGTSVESHHWLDLRQGAYRYRR